MKIAAIDIETTGLDFTSDAIIAVGISNGNLSKVLTSEAEIKETVQSLIKKDYQFVFQNGKFDLRFLSKLGISLPIYLDTSLIPALLKERPLDSKLSTLVNYYLGYPNWKDEVAIKNIKEEDLGLVKSYCEQDSSYTWKLSQKFLSLLDDNEKIRDFYFKYLMPAENLLLNIETTGIKVNLSYLNTVASFLNMQIANLNEEMRSLCLTHIKEWENNEIETKISSMKEVKTEKQSSKRLDRIKEWKEKIKFNFSSPIQLLWLLKKRGIKPIDSLTGKESTKEDALKKVYHRDKLIEKILKLREVEKKQSFVCSWKEKSQNNNATINCTYNMDVTRTGRLSSSEPNMQQVPRESEMRKSFIPREGFIFVEADYSQIEPRLAAHYSKDETLIDLYQNGNDLYGLIATKILNVTCHPNEVKEKYPEMRRVAKEIALSILYGIGAAKLSWRIFSQTGLKYSFKQCVQFINGYFLLFPSLLDLNQRVHKQLIEKQMLFNLYGRPLYMTKEEILNKGTNYLLQSSASDLCLFKQNDLVSELGAKGFVWGVDYKIVLLIHDGILYEVKKGREKEFIKILKCILEDTVFNLRVPLKVDISIKKNWGESILSEGNNAYAEEN